MVKPVYIPRHISRRERRRVRTLEIIGMAFCIAALSLIGVVLFLAALPPSPPHW